MGVGGGLRAIGDGLLDRGGPSLAAAYIRLTDSTTRWTWEGREVFDGIVAARKPTIFVFWHSRILMLCPRIVEIGMPLRVLVSNNRDGELISRVVQKFGQDTIRGSSRNPRKSKDKGGASALRELVRFAADGGSVAITPDGPRGPAMKARAGASIVAAKSGLDVVPVGCATSFGTTLRSWDRFRLSMPFGRGAYVVGEAMAAPVDEPDAVEAHRHLLEANLLAVTKRADDIVGSRR